MKEPWRENLRQEGLKKRQMELDEATKMDCYIRDLIHKEKMIYLLQMNNFKKDMVLLS